MSEFWKLYRQVFFETKLRDRHLQVCSRQLLYNLNLKPFSCNLCSLDLLVGQCFVFLMQWLSKHRHV
ncbi:hypothetical protein Bpfe_009246 [Biomphalaria pfeifferi]|uniref:Uncharacterized protein n=1 Tax=Biomphalaria pfeifferi TaxID=112525 RepID=A0AAD8BX44_BIOPF|nr:hypothetical protein Bpfe_009246 [Biomphalaria pfeifferi]